MAKPKTCIASLKNLIEIDTKTNINKKFNPNNYPYLTYKPKSLEEAYFILYYKLKAIIHTKDPVFPMFFDIEFEGTKRAIAEKLLEKIIDAHILLVSYEDHKDAA